MASRDARREAKPLAAPVRAVLFDLDGTLYLQGPVRLAMACEMGLACARFWGAGASDTRIVWTFRRVREQLRLDGTSDEPLASRQYAAVAERVGCSYAEVERAVEHWIYCRPLKWVSLCRRRGLIELLHFLARRGVRCGIFSDYPAHDKLDALGVARHFDLVLNAADPEVGVLKPDPRGFTVAARKWEIPPHEIVYVGDRVDVDATGAMRAGMQCAVLVNSGYGPADAFLAVTNLKELRRVLERVC